MGGGGGILWFIKPKQHPLEMAPSDAPEKHKCSEHPDLRQETVYLNGKAHTYQWEACSVCGRQLSIKIEVTK